MTALRERKTRLTFETDATIRSASSTSGKTADGRTVRRFCRVDRPIVAEPNPFYCRVRLKGTKQAYEISWVTIFEKAAQIQADRVRAEKRAARKARER